MLLVCTCALHAVHASEASSGHGTVRRYFAIVRLQPLLNLFPDGFSVTKHYQPAHPLVLQALTSCSGIVHDYKLRSSATELRSVLGTHVPVDDGGSTLEARLRVAAGPNLNADFRLPTAKAVSGLLADAT